MTSKCGQCGKAEAEHVYVEGQSFHMFVDEATFARRNAATGAFKARYNKTLADRTRR